MLFTSYFKIITKLTVQEITQQEGNTFLPGRIIEPPQGLPILVPFLDGSIVSNVRTMYST
ncbi:hypothetical protein [Paraflavitalea speifideaquila]|uniref:hypothetical protein n=1 Tax=Paraflavitalea speifideaquila TaxID=3076558 RepID=UPI0028EC1956|nr:hypothetical protein [Paraflavitalea speifideiaquila]